MLGADTFNEDIKAAVADAYFFLADVFIAKESEIKKEKEEAEGTYLTMKQKREMNKVWWEKMHT